MHLFDRLNALLCLAQLTLDQYENLIVQTDQKFISSDKVLYMVLTKDEALDLALAITSSVDFLGVNKLFWASWQVFAVNDSWVVFKANG